MSWDYSQPIENHPMWEEQVKLEKQMLKSGADKFRDRIVVAKEKGTITQTGPVRYIMQDWLPQVADGFKSWVSDSKKARGVTPIALPYVAEADPYVLSIVAVRSLLSLLTLRKTSIVTLAMEMGRTIEHEQKVRLWERLHKEDYQNQQREFRKNKSTDQHQRRVNIHRVNNLMKSDKEFPWEAWSTEVTFRVGIAMLDVTMRVTGWFELLPDPEYVRRPGQFKQKLVVAPKQAFMEHIGGVLERAELYSPDLLPTVVPPKRWEGTREGGYWTEYVKAPALIRFKAHQEHQKLRAADEYDALDISTELEAVHVLQETAWRVNPVVLETALKVWAKGRRLGKLPDPDLRELPPRTPRMVEHEMASMEARFQGKAPPPKSEELVEELKLWKKKSAPIYHYNIKQHAAGRATTETLNIAQQFVKYEAIYFPHMLDFRARKYPIANYLNPQGNELARGLLEFAEGMAVEDDSTAGWIAIQVANSYGIDKEHYEDRIAWVEERKDLWLRIAEDPVSNLEWADPDVVDKPFQTLAAILDWVGYLKEGYGYISHLPIMVDGTCNGIQHLSALTRDEEAGYYVNLIPGDKPRDIYKYVADKQGILLEKLCEEGNEQASRWLAIVGGDVPRSATKRQVMVLPYGGTRESFFGYTRDWLDEFDPIPDYVAELDDESKKAWFQERTKMVTLFALHLWDTVNKVVSGGMKVMEWLKKCAKAAAIDNQPIYWVTPTGFVVRHFYGENRSYISELKLEGRRVVVKRNERTAKLSVKEQLQGIAPNFIHSLDASALTKCLQLAREASIKSFASIHDAYGTHAANMWPLYRILREAFVWVHEQNPLETYRDACKEVIKTSYLNRGHSDHEAEDLAERTLPPMLEMGNLDLKLVLKSDYFFG